MKMFLVVGNCAVQIDEHNYYDVCDTIFLILDLEHEIVNNFRSELAKVRQRKQEICIRALSLGISNWAIRRCLGWSGWNVSGFRALSDDEIIEKIRAAETYR